MAVPAQARPRPCMLALHHQQTYLPRGVTPVAGDEQTTSSYLAASLGQLGTLYEKIVTPGFEGSSAQWTVTRQCFLALATTVYGVGHSHELIATSGRRLYCQSLSLLNNTMQRSYKSQNGMTPVIGAVVALALHEVRQLPFCSQASQNMVADTLQAIAPTNANSHTWLQHIQGLGKLLAIHGPVSETSDPLVKLVTEAMRLPIITASLHSRRSSLMAHPHWKAHGRDGAAITPESHIAYLLDALAQLPSLYEEQDALTSAQTSVEADGMLSPYPASRVRLLLSKSFCLLSDVKTNRAQWDARHPAEAFSSLPRSASGDSAQPCPFQTITNFSSLRAANAFSFYHCILILVSQFILSVHRLLPQVDRDAFAEKQISEAVFRSALDILKSVDYHLPFTLAASRSMASDCGPRNFYLLFPLRVAFRALSEADVRIALPYMLWLRGIFAGIRERAMPWASNEHLFKLD
ncbi:hypothetical protein LEL_02110 [Akanthomyces lecanii RCEF 1005]|uniref:C6 zinc finger domain protein n=1 Tax=Akanthomyces lecanii RCEF 1005 TaxID=1081108 RepID=A0A168L168_CORDF|nr:hypothetical protein LEL_02110 [Akanthomyces lecanii RCEF 1005]